MFGMCTLFIFQRKNTSQAKNVSEKENKIYGNYKSLNLKLLFLVISVLNKNFYF